jgi:PAS domain S-box-containing protein
MTTAVRVRGAAKWPARISILAGSAARRLRIVGVVLAAAAMGLSILAVWNLNQRSLQVATGQIRNLDLALAEQINRYFQVMDLMLQRVLAHIDKQNFATSAAFRDGMADTDDQAYMAGVVANLPPAHAITLFSSSGQFLAGTGSAAARAYNIADRPYFAYLRDHPGAGAAIDLVDPARGSGKPSIVLGRRINAADGTFLGVVSLTVHVRYLLHFYDVLNEQQRVSVNLLRRDGRILVHYPLVEGGPYLMPSNSEWYRLIAHGGGTYRSPGLWSPEPALVAVQPLNDFPLVLDIAIHDADVLAPFRGETAIILGTSTVLGLLTLVLFWSLAHQVQTRDGQTRTLIRTAEALRASEVRLHDFAAMASDWFWEQGPDLRLSWVSTNSPDLRAHDPQRIGQLRWDSHDAKLGPDKWRAHKEDLLAHRPFVDFRYERAAEDGRIRYFSISGRPMFDAAGAFRGYRGIGRHISHQIEMERERDRARARAEHAQVFLRDALDSLSESVVICDEKDALVLVNDVYERRYPEAMAMFAPGRPFESFLRQRISAGEFPDAIGCEDMWLAERMRQHRDVAGGYDRQLRDGTWMWITERRMRSGGTVTMQIDVTGLKQTEIALRRSEERLDLAQAAAGIGTWEYNIDSKSWFASKEMYRARGLDPRSFDPNAENIARFVHPDDLEKIRAWMRDLGNDIKRETIDARIMKADGTQRLFRLDGQAVRDEVGAVRRLVGTSQDITERQQIELRLVQAQKMEAIGNLTGGMAHDFNNILSIVINNLELAEQVLPTDHEAHEWLQDALEASLRGADLTQRLLAFARRQALSFEPVALNDVVTGMQRLLSRVLGEDIVVSLDLAADLWPVVSDRAQIEASIINLATNARDAMPRGGNLQIITSNRHLDADYVVRHPTAKPGNYAVVTVVDDGGGMTPEIIDRMFEPFFTTKGARGGTGLGLSMVFGFMNQANGHISVRSVPENGTELSLFLPRSEARTAASAEAAGAPSLGHGESVLVVEDNNLLRRVVAHQVAGLGYRVLEADCPSTALTTLEKESVDLLFTDIVMPGGLDGFDLARAASSRRPSMRILLTSGFAGHSPESQRGMPPMVKGMLRKPYRRDALAHALRAALDG